MPCRVCNEPETVRSHILPKAIVRMIKAEEKNVVLGSRHKSGYQFSQSGWAEYDLLCHQHESDTAVLDKYGVEFLRRAEKARKLRPYAAAVEVSNPEPQMLGRFALSIVWRSVHCEMGKLSSLSLGRYERDVQEAVFGIGGLKWPLLIGRTQFNLGKTTPGADPLSFASCAHRSRLNWLGHRLATWHFNLAGFSFNLISDGVGAPRALSQFLANGQNPATVGLLDRRPFSDASIYQAAITSMVSGRRRPKEP